MIYPKNASVLMGSRIQNGKNINQAIAWDSILE